MHNWSYSLGICDKFTGWLNLPASLTNILILCSCFKLCRTLSLCCTSASRRLKRRCSSRLVVLKVSWRRMMDMAPESEPFSRYAGEVWTVQRVPDWTEIQRRWWNSITGSAETLFWTHFWESIQEFSASSPRRFCISSFSPSGRSA